MVWYGSLVCSSYIEEDQLTQEGYEFRIYGGYRSRLGPYQVSLDKDIFSYGGFQTGDEERFQYPLFSLSGLQMGMHEVTITNVSPDPERSMLDIDYVSDVVVQRGRLVDDVA